MITLPRRCVLEARAERKAIDAFVNEVGLHIEREEKFACVLSLHGSQLRTVECLPRSPSATAAISGAREDADAVPRRLGTASHEKEKTTWSRQRKHDYPAGSGCQCAVDDI